MMIFKFALGDNVLEEVVRRTSNQIDYYEIAITLLYTGTKFQKDYINSIMEDYIGKRRTRELKWYIDNLIMMGAIEV